MIKWERVPVCHESLDPPPGLLPVAPGAIYLAEGEDRVPLVYNFNHEDRPIGFATNFKRDEDSVIYMDLTLDKRNKDSYDFFKRVLVKKPDLGDLFTGSIYASPIQTENYGTDAEPKYVVVRGRLREVSLLPSAGIHVQP